jgi:hypothetical protein
MDKYRMALVFVDQDLLNFPPFAVTGRPASGPSDKSHIRLLLEQAQSCCQPSRALLNFQSVLSSRNAHRKPVGNNDGPFFRLMISLHIKDLVFFFTLKTRAKYMPKMTQLAPGGAEVKNLKPWNDCPMIQEMILCRRKNSARSSFFYPFSVFINNATGKSFNTSDIRRDLSPLIIRSKNMSLQ